MFYKIYENKSPQYLFKLIPEKTHAHEYAIRNIDTIPCFKIRYNFFKNSFFPFTIIECEQFRSYLWELKKFCCFQKLFKYSKYFDKEKKILIFNSAIEYISSTKRFEEPPGADTAFERSLSD